MNKVVRVGPDPHVGFVNPFNATPYATVVTMYTLTAIKKPGRRLPGCGIRLQLAPMMFILTVKPEKVMQQAGMAAVPTPGTGSPHSLCKRTALQSRK